MPLITNNKLHMYVTLGKLRLGRVCDDLWFMDWGTGACSNRWRWRAGVVVPFSHKEECRPRIRRLISSLSSSELRCSVVTMHG